MASQHQRHRIRNFGRDETPVPDRGLHSGKRVQERTRDRRVDGRESHRERTDHATQDVARPRNPKRRRSLRAHAQLIRTGDNAARTFQDHDLA